MKWILTLLIATACTFSSFGQYVDQEAAPKAKKKWHENLEFSGNIALSFGTVTVIGANPQVGYKVTPTTVLGVGGQYEYYRQRSQFGTYETSIYGGSVFARQSVLENVFLMTEFNRISWEPPYLNSGRKWVNQLYVGGGYRQAISDNFSLGIFVLYDLIQDPNSPYSNPVIRGGGFFGF